ncbi:hypothetical protein WJX72_011312 [[Myrmecia] bisecta]|uniref:J domain-containing protein n=1 Tax=[Myrmecia] bisecta TaxID=41462 RepID=A0AAW1QGI3_9CHLO
MNLGTICQDFMHQADALEELCGAYEAALCMVRGIGAKLQVEPGLGRPVAAAARAQPKPMKSQADTTTSIAPQAGGLESCVAAPTTAAQFGKGPASTAAGGPASQALNEPPGASDNAPPAATASGSGAFVPDRRAAAAKEAEAAKQAPSHPAGHVAMPAKVQTVQGGVVELQRETAWQEAGYAELEADEWERRRLEVARQAEEARRLKKQRRQAAETQQRLTARLEDHRAALAHQQSQAVEKDRLRTIVRQRLQKKVARAKTMHAVLCALGIPVAQGTLVVTKDLVQKAYKKALLQYHPDRHASKPLEVQIECEEIFKLLNSRAAR